MTCKHEWVFETTGYHQAVCKKCGMTKTMKNGVIQYWTYDGKPAFVEDSDYDGENAVEETEKQLRDLRKKKM